MAQRRRTTTQTVTDAARKAITEVREEDKPKPRRYVDTTPVPTLVKWGTEELREWYHIDESRTEVLKKLAITIVKLRAHFKNNDGDTDWTGSSWDYRQTVSKMYREAGIPPDSLANVQAALRYHVGNAMRDMLSKEELEAANLNTKSPRERFREARAELNLAAEALSAASAPTEKARVSRALSAAEHALSAAVAEIDAVDERMAPNAAASIERIVALVEQIRESLGILREDVLKQPDQR